MANEGPGKGPSMAAGALSRGARGAQGPVMWGPLALWERHEATPGDRLDAAEATDQSVKNKTQRAALGLQVECENGGDVTSPPSSTPGEGRRFSRGLVVGAFGFKVTRTCT